MQQQGGVGLAAVQLAEFEEFARRHVPLVSFALSHAAGLHLFGAARSVLGRLAGALLLLAALAFWARSTAPPIDQIGINRPTAALVATCLGVASTWLLVAGRRNIDVVFGLGALGLAAAALLYLLQAKALGGMVLAAVGGLSLAAGLWLRALREGGAAASASDFVAALLAAVFTAALLLMLFYVLSDARPAPLLDPESKQPLARLRDVMTRPIASFGTAALALAGVLLAYRVREREAGV
jgi:hypothetical protein